MVTGMQCNTTYRSIIFILIKEPMITWLFT